VGKKVKKQKSDEATKRWVSGMRDAFSEALYEIICEDERVILITSDTGAVCHDLIKANFPGRYINVGIAEQNLIGVAAGRAPKAAGPSPTTGLCSARCAVWYIRTRSLQQN